MRTFLRVFIFTYISVFVTQIIIGGLFFGPNETITTLLVVLGLSLLNMFIVPIFEIISLPTKGIMHIFMSFLMLMIMLYVLTLFIPSFYITQAKVAKLVIFGIVLPSKQLTVFWSAVFTALMLSVVYNFFKWLCKK